MRSAGPSRKRKRRASRSDERAAEAPDLASAGAAATIPLGAHKESDLLENFAFAPVKSTKYLSGDATWAPLRGQRVFWRNCPSAEKVATVMHREDLARWMRERVGGGGGGDGAGSEDGPSFAKMQTMYVLLCECCGEAFSPRSFLRHVGSRAESARHTLRILCRPGYTPASMTIAAFEKSANAKDALVPVAIDDGSPSGAPADAPGAGAEAQAPELRLRRPPQTAELGPKNALQAALEDCIKRELAGEDTGLRQTLPPSLYSKASAALMNRRLQAPGRDKALAAVVEDLSLDALRLLDVRVRREATVKRDSPIFSVCCRPGEVATTTLFRRVYLRKGSAEWASHRGEKPRWIIRQTPHWTVAELRGSSAAAQGERAVHLSASALERGGVQVGDVLLAINGAPVGQLQPSQLDKLVGDAWTRVCWTFKRAASAAHGEAAERAGRPFCGYEWPSRPWYHLAPQGLATSFADHRPEVWRSFRVVGAGPGKVRIHSVESAAPAAGRGSCAVSIDGDVASAALKLQPQGEALVLQHIAERAVRALAAADDAPAQLAVSMADASVHEGGDPLQHAPLRELLSVLRQRYASGVDPRSGLLLADGGLQCFAFRAPGSGVGAALVTAHFVEDALRDPLAEAVILPGRLLGLAGGLGLYGLPPGPRAAVISELHRIVLEEFTSYAGSAPAPGAGRGRLKEKDHRYFYCFGLSDDGSAVRHDAWNAQISRKRGLAAGPAAPKRAFLPTPWRLLPPGTGPVATRVLRRVAAFPPLGALRSAVAGAAGGQAEGAGGAAAAARAYARGAELGAALRRSGVRVSELEARRGLEAAHPCPSGASVAMPVEWLSLCGATLPRPTADAGARPASLGALWTEAASEAHEGRVAEEDERQAAVAERRRAAVEARRRREDRRDRMSARALRDLLSRTGEKRKRAAITLAVRRGTVWEGLPGDRAGPARGAEGRTGALAFDVDHYGAFLGRERRELRTRRALREAWNGVRDRISERDLSAAGFLAGGADEAVAGGRCQSQPSRAVLARVEDCFAAASTPLAPDAARAIAVHAEELLRERLLASIWRP